MEQKIIKAFSISCLLSALLGCLLLFWLAPNHKNVITAREQRQLLAQQEKEKLSKMSGLELMKYYTAKKEKLDEEQAGIFTQQLRLQLPRGVDLEDLSIDNDYVGQCLTVSIPTKDEDYFYNYPMIGKSGHIVDLNLESDGKTAMLQIMLDGVYELDAEQDNQYLYLDFISPSDLYDKIVVIDAGHGGSDPGAVRTGVNEKDIDLAILLQLKELFDKQKDVKVYYTRTTDENPALHDRVRLANQAGADLFLSIHNNAVITDASTVNGTKAMYNETEEENEQYGSREFAQICLEEVCDGTGSTNLGLEAGSRILIIRESEMPMALIEVGFMSNAAELGRLNSEEYQKQTAESLYRAVMRAYEQGF
ncbi:MAG: N-acetylmuramoyl-L-alanine amidase [Eubacterium sp.]|nr:N-acetylmuramoyl-L-alanine amidase [Eubacterium sp.]